MLAPSQEFCTAVKEVIWARHALSISQINYEKTQTVFFPSSTFLISGYSEDLDFRSKKPSIVFDICVENCNFNILTLTFLSLKTSIFRNLGDCFLKENTLPVELMEIVKTQQLACIMFDFSKLRKQPLQETKRPIQYNIVWFFEIQVIKKAWSI